MSLAIPAPVHPGAAAGARARAYRQWQQGQAHARREHWPAAAQAFERATDINDDPAYGLAAAHALIKAGRAAQAVQRAQQLRKRHPAERLGYTLEARALLELGRTEEALQCLRALPEGVSVDLPYLTAMATALQATARHAEAVPVFLQALSFNLADPVLHFYLGVSFKDLGMKAEAAECMRTAVTLGLGNSELAARGLLLFMEREACRWAEAESEMQQLRAKLRALPPQQPAETSAFSHAVLVDDPIEQLKVARHHALHVASKVQVLPRVRAGTMVGACAWATCRPTSTTTRPASRWCRCSRPTTASDSRSSRCRPGVMTARRCAGAWWRRPSTSSNCAVAAIRRSHSACASCASTSWWT